MDQKNLTKNLIDVLVKINKSSDMGRLLNGLFTPAEIQEFANRLEIVRQLKQGKSQRQVAQNLGVGIATVSRGSKEIKLGNFENI